MANDSTASGYLTPTSAPSADDLGLDTILGQLIEGVTGLPASNVLPRWQPIQPRIPAVTETWCAIGVTVATPDDTPAEIHHPDGNGYSVLRAFYRLDVLASFYGPNSDGYAKLTRDSFYIGQNRDGMRANGLHLIGFDPIKYVPEIVATQSRRRSDLPFRLTQVIERTYTIQNVLQGKGTIQADAGSNKGPVTRQTPFLSPTTAPAV